VKNTKNPFEKSDMLNSDFQKADVGANKAVKSTVSIGLWNVKAIQEYGNASIGRDLAYAIVARLPNLPVKRCGPRISHAVLVEDFHYCIECVMKQNLILREVFCDWSLQKFDSWWLECQETRLK
jgi:hypothetical protein